ncbi:MAG: molybdopterin-dependent oxidoreductase, partial [Vulcanimicrobiota bacterium]
FIKRGFATKIAPALEKPLVETNCIACGNCIDTCPTGALSENQSLMARIGDKIIDHFSICNFCGVGCQLNVKTFGRDMRIRAWKDNKNDFSDYLCMKGRFGSRYLNSKDRIQQPGYRKNGKIHYSEWEDTLKMTSDKLKSVTQKYGTNSVAVLISPRLTNEEIYATTRLAKSVLKTDFIGSYEYLMYGRNNHELDSILGQTVSTNKMDEITETDVVLVINADPLKTNPSFGFKINEARRNGAEIVVINSLKNKLNRHATLWLQPRRGTGALVLTALIKHLVKNDRIDREFIEKRCEGFNEYVKALENFDENESCKSAGICPADIEKLARLLTENNPKTMAVYDFDNNQDRSTNDLAAIANLLLLTGNIGRKSQGLLLPRLHCNITGLIDMGAEPGYLPGRIPMDSPASLTRFNKFWNTDLNEIKSNKKFRELLEEGRIKACLVIGENPLVNPEESRYFRNMEFIAAIDLFRTETTEISDVVLPASTHIESGGTFTRMDRGIQKFKPVKQPEGDLTNLEVIHKISAFMGAGNDLVSPEKVFEEIQNVNHLYSSIELDKDEGLLGCWNFTCLKCPCSILYCNRFGTETGKAHFEYFSPKTQTYTYDPYHYSTAEQRFNEWKKLIFKRSELVTI